MLIEGVARNPLHPVQGASDNILDRYNADSNAATVGSDIWAKINNPLLVDYGPAGMKFQNAIRAILNNPDDPAFAPYVNDLHSAGVALQNGGDKALMASTIAAYLREGARNYQSNMSVNGDLTTGINAWNSLDPSTQNALLVQFYKQGPTPRLAQEKMTLAAEMGAPYVPGVGADGAGATYLANEPAITQALADGPANFSDRWVATNDRAARAADQRSVQEAADFIDSTNRAIANDAPIGDGNGVGSQLEQAQQYVSAPAKPTRILARRVVGRPQMPDVNASSPAAPDGDASFADRFSNWTVTPEGAIAPRNPNLPVPPPEPDRPLGIVTGEPMPLWITPPPIFNFRIAPECSILVQQLLPGRV